MALRSVKEGGVFMSESNGNGTPAAPPVSSIVKPSWADGDFRKRYVPEAAQEERLSAHFFRHEFDCRDGTPYPSEYKDRLMRLVVILEAVRSRFGVPIGILSGYRTEEWNGRVGGAQNSMHMVGRAADFRPLCHDPGSGKSDQSRENVLRGMHDWLASEHRTLTIGGLGYYPDHGFIHVDVRQRPSNDLRLRRWIG